MLHHNIGVSAGDLSKADNAPERKMISMTMMAEKVTLMASAEDCTSFLLSLYSAMLRNLMVGLRSIPCFTISNNDRMIRYIPQTAMLALSSP
jgi:hypothetical protein